MSNFNFANNFSIKFTLKTLNNSEVVAISLLFNVPRSTHITLEISEKGIFVGCLKRIFDLQYVKKVCTPFKVRRNFGSEL